MLIQLHRVGFAQQQEGLMEDITSQPESDAQKRQMEVGTSSEMPRRKGKNPMKW
jgi:hypothetical protein